MKAKVRQWKLTRVKPISESETDFTVEFGAGMEIAISPKMSLFVDGKYVIIMAEDDNITYVPFHVGLIFGL